MLKPMTCLKPEKSRLDAAEGFGNGYDELTVRVESAEGAHEVLFYCATKIDRSAVPDDWYKAFAVAGEKEHGLPPAYIAALEGAPSKVDLDANRAATNAALLRLRWRNARGGDLY